MNIMLFAALIPNSIGIATGIIVGYLFGEKEYEVLYWKCYRNIEIGIAAVIVLDFFLIIFLSLLLYGGLLLAYGIWRLKREMKEIGQ